MKLYQVYDILTADVRVFTKKSLAKKFIKNLALRDIDDDDTDTFEERMDCYTIDTFENVDNTDVD